MGIFGKKKDRSTENQLELIEQELRDEEILKHDKLKQALKCATMEGKERGKHKRHNSTDNLLECQAEALQGAMKHLGRQKQLKDQERSYRFGQKPKAQAPQMEEDDEEMEVDLDE